MARTIVYLPPEDRDAVAEIAARERVSESEVYRRAVAEFLDRQDRKPKP